MQTIPAPLKGKVAIVTGGSRGIGAALARKLAQHGCSHIAITYHYNSAQADEVLREIHTLSPTIHTCAFAADLAAPDFGPFVVQQTLQRLGVSRVDIVLANAAPSSPEDLRAVEQMDKAHFDFYMSSIPWAALTLSRAALAHMPSGGRIVFISSVASRYAFGDPTVAFSAAKAALDSVARNLAMIWGASAGVTVNSISVGGTMTDAIRAGIQQGGEAFENMVAGFSTLKRIADVDEVAEIVAFIASPQASWMIGNSIPANGGGLYVLQG